MTGNHCFYCKKRNNDLIKCKCNNLYCIKCLLPENHKCNSLNEYKQEAFEKNKNILMSTKPDKKEWI